MKNYIYVFNTFDKSVRVFDEKFYGIWRNRERYYIIAGYEFYILGKYKLKECGGYIECGGIHAGLTDTYIREWASYSPFKIYNLKRIIWSTFFIRNIGMLDE